MFATKLLPLPPACLSASLPTVADLVAIAVRESDFMGDLTDDGHELAANAENSADLAAELWEEAHDFPVNLTVPLALIVAVREALVEHGHQTLRDREQDAADALYEGQQAGDLDRDGNVIPYPQYRSV